MRKCLRKRILSLVTAVVMIFSLAFILPNGTGIIKASAANNADSLVSIAEGELNKSDCTKYTSVTGPIGGTYNYAWCASFVSWCARQAGVGSIPNTASCYNMYNGMLNNGCQIVSSPQKGDIVFFYCNSCSGTSNQWCHVGIMINSSTSIDGNYGGKVSYDNSYSHYGSLGYKHSSGIVKKYVRPKYSNIQPILPTTKVDTYNLPQWFNSDIKIQTYNEYGNPESGHYISQGDKGCCIHEVYVNNYALVEYPLDSGGTRKAYTKLSDVEKWLTKKSTNHSPVGYVDLVEGGEGSVHVRGWVYDPDSSSQSLEVHVYIGGNVGESSIITRQTGVMANQYREDVNKAFGISGNHGFDQWISTDARGNQPVYIHVVDANDSTGNTIVKRDNIERFTANINGISPTLVLSKSSINLDLCGNNEDKITITAKGDLSSKYMVRSTIPSSSKGGMERSFEKDGDSNIFYLTINGKKTGDFTTNISILRTDTEEVVDTKSITVSIRCSHNYTHAIVKPTCTEKGYTKHTCSVCSDTYTDNVNEATGHNFGEWTTRVEPTTTSEGIEVRICLFCDKEETRAIEKLTDNSSKADDSSSDVDEPSSKPDSSSSKNDEPSSQPDNKPDKQLGDVNADGTIDIEDAVRIINHINGVKALTDEQFNCADVDGNGSIDIEDAVRIVNHINGVKAID